MSGSLISMAIKPWPELAALEVGERIVTRRSKKVDGAWLPAWTHRDPGALLQAVEWARVGKRWVCLKCKRLASKDPDVARFPAGTRWSDAGHLDCPGCGQPDAAHKWRGPRRGPTFKLIERTEERLSNLATYPDFAAEMALELLDCTTPEDFVQIYTGGKGDDRPVARLLLEVVEVAP